MRKLADVQGECHGDAGDDDGLEVELSHGRLLLINYGMDHCLPERGESQP
jgi:hypothetical protein